jgi:hypothetical protein
MSFSRIPDWIKDMRSRVEYGREVHMTIAKDGIGFWRLLLDNLREGIRSLPEIGDGSHGSSSDNSDEFEKRFYLQAFVRGKSPAERGTASASLLYKPGDSTIRCIMLDGEQMTFSLCVSPRDPRILARLDGGSILFNEEKAAAAILKGAMGMARRR